MTLKHKFIEKIPDKIEEGVIYISMDHCTAIHSCACGCGNEVVTPFSPLDWNLKFDGKTISIRPSIGNWNFECKSHYWISNNRIEFLKEDRKKSRRRFIGIRNSVFKISKLFSFIKI